MEIKSEIVRPDRSKEYLRKWKSQGFTFVKLKLIDTSCRVCRSVRNIEFHIDPLLIHDNPLYRLTHPNCNCGLLPIQESHENHENYNIYKKKIEDLRKKDTHIAPDKDESPEEHKEEKDQQTQKKLEDANKEIKNTEDKIEKLEPATTPGIKDNLKRYLDKLKKVIRDFSTKPTKNPSEEIKNTNKEIADTQNKLDKIEEKSDTSSEEKTKLTRYLDKLKKFVSDLRNK